VVGENGVAYIFEKLAKGTACRIFLDIALFIVLRRIC